jgi:hypothetical protein
MTAGWEPARPDMMDRRNLVGPKLGSDAAAIDRGRPRIHSPRARRALAASAEAAAAS